MMYWGDDLNSNRNKKIKSSNESDFIAYFLAIKTEYVTNYYTNSSLGVYSVIVLQK